MWVALALGAALLTSFNPILYKRILQDAEPLVVVWGVTLLALPLLGLFTLALTPEYPRIDRLFVLSVLWGSLFLKERNLTERLPASLVMVVGAVLIALRVTWRDCYFR